MKTNAQKQSLELAIFLLKKIKEYPNKHYNAYGELKKILEESVKTLNETIHDADKKRSNTSSKANSLYPD